MRYANLIGSGIESQPMRSRNVSGPRRCHRDLATKLRLGNLLELQSGAWRRIALALMMGFFDKRIVGFDVAKQLSSPLCDAVENLYANRKIRAIDQSPIRIFYD